MIMPSGMASFMHEAFAGAAGHEVGSIAKSKIDGGLDWMPDNCETDFAEIGQPLPIAESEASDEEIYQFKAAVLAKLTLAVGKDAGAATDRDWFVASALTLRDRIIHRWLAVDRASQAKGRKRVYYMSLEFLIGRLFSDVVEN